MKTYANRSNAVRAAKTAFGAEWQEVVNVMLAVDGKGFTLVPVAPVEPVLLAAPAALVAEHPVVAPAAAPAAVPAFTERRLTVAKVSQCPACQHNPKGACVVCAVGMDDDLVPQPAPDTEQSWALLHTGHNNCPHCNIDLENGVTDWASNNELQGSGAGLAMTHEWACLACGGEWGELRARGTGIKIQKDREERNGIKRPSTGGACAAVWDWCDAVVQHTNTPPTAKEVKAKAAEAGWNANNATIEYYGWRKWMGIVGRAKSPTAK